MKVLLINNEHARVGGAHSVYFNIGEMLEKEGHEVYYFAQKTRGQESCEQSVFFPSQIPKTKMFRYGINYIYNRLAKKRLESLLKYYKPDVAHIHLLYGGLTSSVLSVLKKYQIPVVYTVHDYRLICPRFTLKGPNNSLCEKCSNGKYYHCLFQKCYKGSFFRSLIMTMEMYFRNLFYPPHKYIDAFVFVSNFGLEKHKEMNRHFCDTKNYVLYNSRNDTLNNISIDDVDSFEGPYLCYGRLAYEKGVVSLVEAFKQFPKLKLEIVGSGPEEQKIRTMIADAPNIKMIGYKSGKELFDIVKMAKFVCVPSEWYEMLGMTVIEGYTLGVPCIAANIGGLAEIVEEGITGYKFSSGNLQSLINVIEKTSKLSRKEYNNMKKNAILFSGSRFQDKAYIPKLIEIYKSVIQS